MWSGRACAGSGMHEVALAVKACKWCDSCTSCLPVPVGGGGHDKGSGGQGDGGEDPEEVELLSLREASTLHNLQSARGRGACLAGRALRSASCGAALTPRAMLRGAVHLQLSGCPV